eukprot:XP_001692893.1 predicted protein [Chlamydomonas reinhardtii]
MVSKQEVAAAFKAAAEALGVDDDELGDLAYTLSKLSEEELEFVPIRASNKAIVAFARKASAAGVGSAAGAGAAAGQGTAQAGDAVAAAGLGMGSAAGAGRQGDVLPRLLAAGRLGDLAPPPPLSGGEEEEEWEPPPDGDVRFIATSRVRGLTLRQAAEQWGYIQPTAAAAAVHALKVLHAADIRAAGGGSGGRFLHGDIRLSNFMFLLPAAEAAVGPRCVVIDLGLSRLDGTEAEQQAEVRQLEQRLQCGSG